MIHANIIQLFNIQIETIFSSWNTLFHPFLPWSLLPPLHLSISLDRLTGLPENRARLANRPQQVLALAGFFVDDIAVGSEHTVALTSTGDVWGWGSNSDGQLGLGHFNTVREPVLVGSLQGKNIQQVRSYTVALQTGAFQNSLLMLIWFRWHWIEMKLNLQCHNSFSWYTQINN